MMRVNWGFLFLIAFQIHFFAQNNAIYTVTFNSNWSNTTHPHTNFPAGAHWSPLVVSTHNHNFSFFNIGEIATQGIEDIAERGRDEQLKLEYDNAMAQGNADFYVEGGDLPSALGEIIVPNVAVSKDFPLLTLVAMIAPSPDWFIGLSGINLLENDGTWKTSISLDLYPYDSGTDDAMDYVHTNMDSNPKQPIRSLQNTFPFSNEKVGSVSIELVEVLSTSETQPKTTFQFYPNPVQDVLFVSSEHDFQQIKIYNTSGALVNSFKYSDSKKEELNVSKLISGVYFIEVLFSNGNNKTQKIIKS